MDPGERQAEIERILSFVADHRESYASLAVCRRALDPGLPAVTPQVVTELRRRLEGAPDDEIEAYYSIIM